MITLQKIWLIYYTDKGGLTPGTYKCNPRLKEWIKE